MAYVTMKRNPNYQIDFDTLKVRINPRNNPIGNPNREWNPTYVNGRYCYKLIPMTNVADFDQNPTYDTSSTAWVIPNSTDFDTPISLVHSSGNNLNPNNYSLRQLGYYNHWVYDLASNLYWLDDITRDQEYKATQE